MEQAQDRIRLTPEIARMGSREMLIRRKLSRSKEKLGTEAALVSAINSYIIIHSFLGKRGEKDGCHCHHC
jgi:hypothetical protein